MFTHSKRHQTLIFHRVADTSDDMDPYTPTLAWFDRLVGSLKRTFNIIPLSEAVERAQRDQLPRASLSITFDDGYADNHLNALPVLEKHQVPATFFVATGYLDGGRMWNDSIIETVRRAEPGAYQIEGVEEPVVIKATAENRRDAAHSIIKAWKHLEPSKRQELVDAFSGDAQALPDDLMMTREQVKRMSESAYAEIGGHTVSHPILLAQQDEAAADEIIQGKQELERITGQRISLFAYPNGKKDIDFSDAHARFVKEAGFDAAVSTNMGWMTKSTDVYQIPRFSPWTRNIPRFHIDLWRARFGLI